MAYKNPTTDNKNKTSQTKMIAVENKYLTLPTSPKIES